MRNQRGIEIKVGIVTILGIAVFIFGITFGRGYHEAISSQIIKFRFPNSGGISQTSPVVVNGVKRGSVLTIDNDNGSVIITASIDKIDDLMSDVTARITILEITGGKKIELIPGKSNQKLNINTEIPGITPPDLPELITLVGEISGDAIKMIRRFDTLTSYAVKLFEGGEMVDNIKITAENTAQLTTNLNAMLNENISDIDKSIKNLKIITDDIRIAIKDNTPRVENLLSSLDTTTSRLNSLLAKAEKTIEGADLLLTDLISISEAVKNGNGLASKLIYDDKFAAKLESSIKDITDFINQVKKYGVNTNVSFGSKP